MTGAAKNKILISGGQKRIMREYFVFLFHFFHHSALGISHDLVLFRKDARIGVGS